MSDAIESKVGASANADRACGPDGPEPSAKSQPEALVPDAGIEFHVVVIPHCGQGSFGASISYRSGVSRSEMIAHAINYAHDENPGSQIGRPMPLSFLLTPQGIVELPAQAIETAKPLKRNAGSARKGENAVRKDAPKPSENPHV